MSGVRLLETFPCELLLKIFDCLPLCDRVSYVLMKVVEVILVDTYMLIEPKCLLQPTEWVLKGRRRNHKVPFSNFWSLGRKPCEGI